MKRLAGSLIGLLLVFTVSVSTLARSCDPSKETCIDKGLVVLIDSFAQLPGTYNPDWQISLPQYKAWIALITLREAGKGRYVAHSGSRGIDYFPHRDRGYKFPFSTGIGAFQLDNCDEKDKVCAGQDWSFWPTIDKLNPTKSLMSVLRWHFLRFDPNGPIIDEDQKCGFIDPETGKRKPVTLEIFQRCTKWLAVNVKKDKDVSIDWDRITGGKCPWRECKVEKREDVEFDTPVTDDPFEDSVKLIGQAYWNLEGWKDNFDTWCITAREWGGGVIMTYYYAFNQANGQEMWVWRDPKMQLIYRHARKYTETRLPEGKGGRFGFTDEEPALQLPPNRLPIANAAGPNLVFVRENVALDGTKSSDPDCDSLQYSWKFIRKPPNSKAVLSKAKTPNPQFRPDKAGDYLLELTVDDKRGGTATAQVTVTAVQQRGKSADVFLLVDLSGSFNNELQVFKTQAASIVSGLLWSGFDVRVGLGRFEDYPIPRFGKPSAGDKAYERVLDLTDPRKDSDGDGTSDILEAIQGLSTRDGDDYPQSQLPALFQAATGKGQDLSAQGFPEASIPPGQQANFRSPVRIIILWTDYSFHRPNDAGGAIPYPGPTFDETIKALQAKKIKVIGIASGSDPVADLKTVATGTKTLAPKGGVDCDGDGLKDLNAGDPLVCQLDTDGSGLKEAIIALVEAEVVGSRTQPLLGTEDLLAGNSTAQIQVFDLSGRLLYDSGFVGGSNLRWEGLTRDGRRVANGVYLYVVTVRTLDGRLLRSEVRKLVILR